MPPVATTTQTVVNDVSANLPAIEQTVQQVSSVKTGWKTSEFWIVLGTDITAVLGGVLPANSIWVKCVSYGVIGLTSLAYLWGRISHKNAAIRGGVK